MNNLKAIALAAICACTNAALAQSIAVKAQTLYTMAGDPIKNAVVIIQDGRIAAVGPADATPIPAGLETVEAPVVTPGLIDAHNVAGLAGMYNGDGQAHDQDQLETSAPIQPELRATDAYNAREPLVAYLRSFGVTTVHTGHGPGELISGQTMVVKTVGDTIDDALIKPTVALAATLDPAAIGGAGKPGTRGKAYAMLRAELIKAQEYAANLARHRADTENTDVDETDETDKPAPSRDLRLETLAKALAGDLPMLITANRAQDIASALRLKDEFGFTLWLDMAAEAYALTDEIKAAGIPVVIHPTMYRAVGDTENLSFETAATLADAGIDVSLQGGFEGYVPKVRVVLFEAAWAAANGLGFQRALETITINPAKLLGIDDRVGSIQPGKDGDLVLYTGDPFEYTTRVTTVIIEGQIVSAEPR